MKQKIILFSLIAVVIILMSILIYGPSFANEQLEEVAETKITNLLEEIPDNKDVYLSLYQRQFPDTTLRHINRFQVEITKLEGLAGYMWARLDSANQRRKNKNHNFLLKEGYVDQFGQGIHMVDSLADLLHTSPVDRKSWSPSSMTGNPKAAQAYLTEWILFIKKKEKEVLEAL